MTNHWRVARFDEILNKVDRKFMIDDDKEYETVGVRWYGNGAFLRERLLGANINRKQQWVIKAGDVVYNKLFAWKNAFAIADETVDGRIVSDKFPTYKVKTDLLEPKYLEYYFKTPQIGTQAQNLSKGGAAISKLTLNPPQFWDLTIPLPPLTEQRRIVAHIELLAARVNEAQRLREEANKEGVEFFAAATYKIFTGLAEKCHRIPIGDTFAFRLDLIRPIDGKTGKIRFVGLQHVESDTGRKLGEDILDAEELKGRKFHFSPGEIVYGYLRPYLNKVWIADCEGVCSVDQYVIRPNKRIVDTDYLAHFMRSPVFLQRAIELTHNLMLPRLRSGLFESILIPVPPLSEQRRIVTYLDGLQAKVNPLRELQSASGEELSALMPSILDKAFKGEL